MRATGRNPLSAIGEAPLTQQRRAPAPPPGIERSHTGPGFIIVMVLALVMLALVAIAPMGLEEQAIFGAGTCVSLVIMRRFANRYLVLAMVFMSMAVSTRYIFWRITATTGFTSPLDSVLGWTLLGSEIYALFVLAFSYVQTSWPLHRRPVPLPDDVTTWPTVDVFIPTYNEPLSIVRDTIFAAMSIDYPRDKLKVWCLDDGRRPEFQRFCESTGCGYLTRPDNLHAKAGNLNNALQHTDGEMIAFFDCDHVPTRGFLQMTLGWLVQQPNMAVVQTPHHFYSPDPFERNLGIEHQVPPEGRLFYGLVQDGNDFWNATFFCGSCAVVRRAALDSVGGFATETVTEDAHTALRLHRAGWNSAYLDIPLAAGLATERFALHVGQRVRWARGMVQIFRRDNPFLGRGLSLGQRICYTNAMAHFLFALPRVVFLLAPLSYLILDINIIRASAFMLLAFAGPHIFHTLITNAYVQGKYRHSFWNEIYETSLAFHLLVPTLKTLIAPKSGGGFNVTAKGGVVEKDYFDARLLRPHLLVSLALVTGLVLGGLRLWWGVPPDVRAVILLNLAWAGFNLLVMLAVLSVGRERRQVRSAVRVEAELPATVFFPDGHQTGAWTLNLSKGGGAFRLEDAALADAAEKVVIRLPCGTRDALFPAQVVTAGRGMLRVQFAPLTLEEEQLLVTAILGRGDAWSGWEYGSIEGPFRSMLRVFGLAFGGIVTRDGGERTRR
ncbi:MAG: UDP-forming cellulose synthase catalytic subunit [Stellaceae bacterium]